MTAHYLDTLFTPEVKRQQQTHGSRDAYARMAGGEAGEPDALGQKENLFLATRDSFYLASNSASGWPYVQHRGGPPGFVKLLGERRIGFADYRGNRQYISLGNVATDDRVALFFMDYVRQARLKLIGRMRVANFADVPELAAMLVDESYGARAERGFVIHVEAFDWNCPQHITPRYTERDIAEMVAPLQQRIADLEAVIGRLPEDRT